MELKAQGIVVALKMKANLEGFLLHGIKYAFVPSRVT